ncbi:MAG: mechanosensitive ion channel domain-containing protein [Pseudomonadota bacterium]
MEGEFSALIDSLSAFATVLRNVGATLILPSRLMQLAVATLCLILAWIANRWISPRLEAWMRGLAGRPKWQLRVLLVLQRRMTLLLFALFVWIAALVFAQIYTFPSRRYVLVLIATIASVWFVIRIIAQIVRNRFLRRIIIWGLSLYVVLYFFGLVDATSTALDSIAIEFGEFRLTLLALFKAVIVTAVLFSAAGLVTRTAAGRLRRNPDISPSMQELTIKALQIVLFSAAFLIGLKAVGFDLTGLAVLSGAIGVGIGFGLQKVVSNLVSGVIILLDKSIKPGDVISLGETFGWIEQLSARYVSVVTRDGREYLIPNEDLITGQVVNWSFSDNFVRLDINFGTAYDADPHQVRQLAIDAAMSVDRVLAHKRPVCHITGFGDSSVDYVLRFWIADPSMGLTNIRGNVFLALWDTFQTHDISIPFPQREVKVLKGSQLDTGSVGNPS